MSAKTILQIKNLDISFRTNAGVVHAIRGINLDLQRAKPSPSWANPVRENP